MRTYLLDMGIAVARVLVAQAVGNRFLQLQSLRYQIFVYLIAHQPTPFWGVGNRTFFSCDREFSF